jgi:16S rRNA processing protein RimM
MQNTTDELLLIGHVIGTHGLRGDLKVRSETGSESLLDAKCVFFRQASGVTVSYRPLRATRHKGNLLLRLDGLGSIESVQSLVGCEVLLAREDLGALPEDEYYWFQLEGLLVEDLRLGSLGRLDEVMTTAAHDVYVVHGPYGEVLIPAVEAFVTEVDPETGRMLVDLPVGLVEESDDV